jgi:hypothetical protein
MDLLHGFYIVAGAVLAIVIVYVVVRVGSIAHFRTKAEYDRDQKWRK